MKDLAQLAVFVFAGAQVNLVSAHDRFLGIALAALWHLFAVRLTHFFDDDLFDDLFGQNGGFFVVIAAFQDLCASSSSSTKRQPMVATVWTHHGTARWL